MKRLLAFALLIFSTTMAHGEDGSPSVTEEISYIGESEHFRLYCNYNTRDCGLSAEPDLAEQADELLERMEEVYGWLEGHGFPVTESRVESGADDKYLLRLDPDPEGEHHCGEDSTACHLNTPSRIYLPKVELGAMLDNPATLAHEFLHSLQAAPNDSDMDWLVEAVPTAVGTMFGTRYGWDMGVYEPIFYMSLDRPFYHVVDRGYGNWAYLLSVGRSLGSPDFIAYLAKSEFLDVEKTYGNKPEWASMALLYDGNLVGTRTFDRGFPEFVAKMNNIEPSHHPGETAHHYYVDITEHTVRIPGTDIPFSEGVKGSVLTYAVAPMLMTLEMTTEPGARPRDTLMMADLEVVTGNPAGDLTLVVEHKKADEPRHETLMLDGSSPPAKPVFVRIVNAPEKPRGKAEPNEFELRLMVRPISLSPPACFQVGEPGTFETYGFDPDDGKNWRLVTDNGTVDGLAVTPAHAGEMTVTLEVDSPVTRGATGIDPVEPATSEVELGRYNVVDDDCMVRLTAGPAQFTYTAEGAYTEFRAPTGEALYFKEGDLAIHTGGGWESVPPMAKQMMFQAMMEGNPAIGLMNDGEESFAFMPLTLSEKFSWKNLRNAVGPDGDMPRKTAAPCPHGGAGCSKTTFLMDGHPADVVFDAQNRPVRITFMDPSFNFEYGTWSIRRPPGW